MPFEEPCRGCLPALPCPSGVREAFGMAERRAEERRTEWAMRETPMCHMRCVMFAMRVPQLWHRPEAA